jgi:hypothetical protein
MAARYEKFSRPDSEKNKKTWLLIDTLRCCSDLSSSYASFLKFLKDLQTGIILEMQMISSFSADFLKVTPPGQINLETAIL